MREINLQEIAMVNGAGGVTAFNSVCHYRVTFPESLNGVFTLNNIPGAIGNNITIALGEENYISVNSVIYPLEDLNLGTLRISRGRSYWSNDFTIFYC